MLKNTIALTLMIFVLASCGAKNQSTNIKLRVSNLLASGSLPINGGVVVVGHTLDDSENFKMVLADASSDIVLDLKKGKWEFAAISWDGDINAAPATGGPYFKGTNRCAYVGIVDLTTDFFTINFNLSAATCGYIPNHGEIVSHPNFLMNNYQFKTLSIQTCNQLDVTNGICTNLGLTKSFKIGSIGNQKGSINKLLPSLGTGCIVMGGAPQATVFKIPVGNIINGKKENLMEVSVFAFQSSDCTGSPIEYRFNDSLYGGINQPNLKAHVASQGNVALLSLEHNPSTVSNNIGFNPFGYGKDGDWNLTGGYAQVISDYGRITNVGTMLDKKIYIDSSNSPVFDLNDEIMWYVNSDGGNGCGDFIPGMFGFAQISQKVSVTEFVLDHSLRAYLNSPPLAGPIILNMPIDYTNAGCSIQIVRVRQYRDLTITGVPTISVYSYSPVSGLGGLFPFKVSNEMKYNSSADRLAIDATGKGTNVPTNACYADRTYGNGNGKRCLRMGGSAIDTSVHGGGIILAMINRINFLPAMGSFRGDFQSQGNTGLPGSDGGSIYVEVKDIVYTGIFNPSIDTMINGGNGGNGGNPGFSVLKFCNKDSHFDFKVGGSIFPPIQGCNF